MGGKAVLILVLGVAYILTIFNTRTGNVNTTALDNYLDYYYRTNAHQIAVSGMNIAAAKLYANYAWRTPMTDIPFSNGEFNINFVETGDTLKVISSAEFEGYQDSVIAYFTGLNDLLKYTFFTANENGVAWTPGDSIFGQIHTNGTLNHQNDNTIVFSGKVTAGKGIKAPPKNSKTQFLGGYEVGIYVPEVVNIDVPKNAAAGGGYVFPDAGEVMSVEFWDDEKISIWSGSNLIHDKVSISTLTSNGVIYSDGDIIIKKADKVDTPLGGVTIASGNNIQIDDNQLEYKDNPLTNPNSNDLLALVALNDIIFDNSTVSDWTIQAVLMAVNGQLTATNMNKNGKFNYLGSVYQHDRGNAKMFQSFQKRYYHDARLTTYKPPAYPGTASLQLIYWWE
jgi:hypothetical protein